MTKTTYNVGDQVRVLNARGIVGGSTLGSIATVDRLFHDGRPFLNGLIIAEDEMKYIEKVVAPTKPQSFKLGDQVRILDVYGIDCAPNYYNNGDITTVVGTDSDGDPRIARYKGDTHGLVILRSERKHLELVPKERDHIAEGFARHGLVVGDKVRVLDASRIMLGHRLHDGMVTEVIGIAPSGSPRIKTRGGDTHGLVIMQTELEFIEKVEAPAKETTYKVGDQVRILNVGGIMFGERYWDNGDITTVTTVSSRGGMLHLDRKTGDSGGLLIKTSELQCIEKVEATAKTTYEEYRVGDQVRILNVDKIAFGDNYWKTGDITTVKAVSRNGSGSLRLDRKNGERIGLIITEREAQYLEKVYEAPVAVQPTTTTTPTMHTRLVALEAKVAEQAAKIHALETGNVDVISTASYDSQPVITFAPTAPTKNAERAAVIAKAKKFVTDITDEMGNGRNAHRGNNTFRRYMTKPVFTETGRTVSVKVVGKYGSTQVFETSSATASSNDTFNRHIGEAIVLGRALGLDVAEFENAPQPTHLVVGTVTRGEYVKVATTVRVSAGKAYDKEDCFWSEEIADNMGYESGFRVLEDTNADYGMGEF